MENIKNNFSKIQNNFGNIQNNVQSNLNNISKTTSEYSNQFRKKVLNFTPYGTENFLTSSSEFLNSNTLIAKATFLLFIIIIFVILFYVASRVIAYFLTPSETPYIIDGMKDATQPMVIPQSLNKKTSIPVLRSKDEYGGVEFTYSFWMYVTNPEQLENTYKHVFHKGSTNIPPDNDGIYGPNNCPGVYLYTGRNNTAQDNYPVMGMLVRLNIYHDSDSQLNPLKYYDDINIDGLPLKKWINVIIRITNQNLADVYINGTLTKRHKLSNVVKQNYDNLYINYNNGFSGNLSNLRYYNYAIGAFEIDRIVSSGPNLKIAENTSISKSKPYYLSDQWFYNGIDPLTE